MKEFPVIGRGRPVSKVKMKQVNATVTAEQFTYLKGHNGSAKIREALDLLMAAERFHNA
jgi:ABC-type ATPase involved in cell division